MSVVIDLLIIAIVLLQIISLQSIARLKDDLEEVRKAVILLRTLAPPRAGVAPLGPTEAVPPPIPMYPPVAPPPDSPIPVPPYQPVPALPYEPVPVPSYVPVPPDEPVPPPPPGLLPTPAPAPTRRFAVNENFFGRNILPLLAAALGLVGLIFLGILVVPHLTDAVKIGAMFVLSLGVAGLGYWLNHRRSTVLTQALIGTGVGGLFISIIVTHLFFHAISDIAAYVMLAVWVGGSMWLSKHLKSLVIAVLAHAGMVVSVTTAYVGGMADDKLILLMAYQIVATTAIIVGDFLWVRPLYRFGLFASQALIILSVTVMWGRLMGTGPDFESSLPVALIVAAFVIQFLGATVIAYLLFVSTARIEGRELSLTLGLVNATLWVVVLIAAITLLLAKLAGRAQGVPSGQIWAEADPGVITASLLVTLGLALVPSILTLTVGRQRGIRAGLQVGTVVPLVAVSIVLLAQNSQARFIHGLAPACLWFGGLALVYVVLATVTRSGVARWIGWGLLGLDTFVMLVPLFGYGSLSQAWTVWAAVAYLACLVGLAWLNWRQEPAELRERLGPWVTAAVFLAVVASLIDAVSSAPHTAGSPLYGFQTGFVVLVTAGLLAALHFTAPSRPPAMVYRLAELTTIVWSAVTLYGDGIIAPQVREAWIEIVLVSLAVLGLVAVVLDRIRGTARETAHAARTPGAPVPETWPELISGIGLTVAVPGLLVPYDWFVSRTGWPFGYPTSLACMVVALAIVGLGLWSRVKELRLYGLVIVIACVLKLVTLDIGSVTSITRVIAFLGGAAVCFGISALYNYAAKHFDKALAAEPAPDLPTPTPLP